MAVRPSPLGIILRSDAGGGVLTGPGDQINTNPLLGPLQDNGGPTFTHALLPGSPAIDAGDPSFTPPFFYDQRGPDFIGYETVASTLVRLKCRRDRLRRPRQGLVPPRDLGRDAEAKAGKSRQLFL